MKLTLGTVLCAVAGLLAGFLAMYMVRMPHTPAPPVTEAAAAIPAVQKNQKEVIDAVYPLYSNGISWSTRVPVSLPPNSIYNPADKVIVGYQVSSLPTASTEDIGGVVGPVRHGYDQLLIKNGWKIDTAFEADGPGGSLWGFKKGSDILILSYTSTFMNQEPNTPGQCPCTIVFTIIGGTFAQ